MTKFIKNQGPLASPDPKINAYNNTGFSYIPKLNAENPNYKQMVGDFIYPYVEEFVGEYIAPLITGMLIDSPIYEIKIYLYNFKRLYSDIGECVDLHNQSKPIQPAQAQAPTHKSYGPCSHQ